MEPYDLLYALWKKILETKICKMIPSFDDHRISDKPSTFFTTYKVVNLSRYNPNKSFLHVGVSSRKSVRQQMFWPSEYTLTQL